MEERASATDKAAATTDANFGDALKCLGPPALLTLEPDIVGRIACGASVQAVLQDVALQIWDMSEWALNEETRLLFANMGDPLTSAKSESPSSLSASCEASSSSHGSNNASCAVGLSASFLRRRYAKSSLLSTLATSKQSYFPKCRLALKLRRNVDITSAPLKGSRCESMKNKMTPALKTSESSEEPFPATTSGAT